jgi:RNA polymerase sigma-70 factor, ECF subfamily
MVERKARPPVAIPPGSESEYAPHREKELGTLTDVELAGLLRNRDAEAHAFVFREWTGTVRGASFRVLRSPDHVDDVVQRVFEELWKSPERFDPGRGSIDQYLAMQGHSRSIDLLRSEVSRARRESTERDAREWVAVSLDEGDEMRRWLEYLPTCEREVIQLAYVRQLTYEEVAVQLALPPGTVKSRIRRGLQRLRAVISSEDAAESVALFADP